MIVPSASDLFYAPPRLEQQLGETPCSGAAVDTAIPGGRVDQPDLLGNIAGPVDAGDDLNALDGHRHRRAPRFETSAIRAVPPARDCIAALLIDRSDLLDTLAKFDGQDGWAGKMLGRVDEVKRSKPGSRRVKMPRTSDFQ